MFLLTVLQFESESSSDEEEVPPCKVYDKIESTDTLESLKSLIKNSFYVKEDKALLIKIRRRHALEDFCLKISKSWIKEKLGNIIAFMEKVELMKEVSYVNCSLVSPLYMCTNVYTDRFLFPNVCV